MGCHQNVRCGRGREWKEEPLTVLSVCPWLPDSPSFLKTSGLALLQSLASISSSLGLLLPAAILGPRPCSPPCLCGKLRIFHPFFLQENNTVYCGTEMG